MKNPNGTELAAAQKALVELQDQQSELTAKIAELEQELVVVDVSHAEKAISQIEDLEAGLNARRRALSLVNQKMPSAEKAIEICLRAEREKAAVELRAEEKKAYAVLIARLVALDKALSEHTGIIRTLYKTYKLQPQRDPFVDLASMIQKKLEFIKRNYPEDLGLPPKPTRQQMAVKEAQLEVQRITNLLEGAKQTHKIQKRNESEQMVEFYELALVDAKKQLAKVK